ncbi:hypothetical protein V22_06460 [Calycomorphotria hydatis]|uniref:Uncharacterized protein n=1 Tax=Calycomorphotria hydatis TaxID=2528027 RepID=A0A517T4X4_9PLAN|nr:hypothetical protein V22_06460 [Calycomorphotria hydatis]
MQRESCEPQRLGERVKLCSTVAFVMIIQPKSAWMFAVQGHYNRQYRQNTQGR